MLDFVHQYWRKNVFEIQDTFANGSANRKKHLTSISMHLCRLEKAIKQKPAECLSLSCCQKSGLADVCVTSVIHLTAPSKDEGHYGTDLMFVHLQKMKRKEHPEDIFSFGLAVLLNSLRVISLIAKLRDRAWVIKKNELRWKRDSSEGKKEA